MDTPPKQTLQGIMPTWLRVSGVDVDLQDRVSISKRRLDCRAEWLRDACSKIGPIYFPAIGMFEQMRPFCYFNMEVARLYLECLSYDTGLTIQMARIYKNQLTHGVQVLLRQSTTATESEIKIKDPREILLVESVLHPEYQTRAEHVLQPFLRLALSLIETRPVNPSSESLRPRKEKKTPPQYQGLSLGAMSQPLEKHGLGILTTGFIPQVRNAIAHGTVRFRADSIGYLEDGKADINFSGPDFAELSDALTDSVHGMCFALLLFFSNIRTTDNSLDEAIPLGIKLIWAKEYSRSLGAEINTALEVEHHSSDQGRLHVFCTSDSKSRDAYLFTTLRLAYAIHAFGATNYEDYWMSIDVGEGIPASYEIRPERMIESFERMLPDLVSTQLLWHDKGRSFRHLHTLKHSIAHGMNEFRRRTAGVFLFGSGLSHLYEIRDIKNISVQSTRRLRAEVILRTLEFDADALRHIIKDVVAELRKVKVKPLIFKESGSPGRVSYIYISIHLRDARIRTLKRSGKHPKFFMFAEWPAPKRIIPTDFFGHWSIDSDIFAHLNPEADVFSRVFPHLDKPPEV